MSTQTETTDKPAKRSLEEILREAWLGALGTLERTESEIHRLGERLREAVLGDESLVADVTARVRQRRDDFERRVDEGVRHAITRMSTPVRDEIVALSQRLDRLASRLDDQAQRRVARRPDATAGRGGSADDGTTTRSSEGGPADERSDGIAR